MTTPNGGDGESITAHKARLGRWTGWSEMGISGLIMCIIFIPDLRDVIMSGWLGILVLLTCCIAMGPFIVCIFVPGTIAMVGMTRVCVRVNAEEVLFDFMFLPSRTEESKFPWTSVVRITEVLFNYFFRSSWTAMSRLPWTSVARITEVLDKTGRVVSLGWRERSRLRAPFRIDGYENAGAIAEALHRYAPPETRWSSKTLPFDTNSRLGLALFCAWRVRWEVAFWAFLFGTFALLKVVL